MKLGTGELITLIFVLVVVFSASRMGSLGNALGKFVHSFKKASRGEGFVDGKVTRVSGMRGTEDAEVSPTTSEKKKLK
jgi:sec-independent protein translocase protein TatA